jgi:hypothetical protein
MEDFMRLASVIVVLTASLLASCSGGHSGPATAALEKQLVGHWSTSGDDNLYYGPADPSSKIGSFIMVHPDGKAFTHRYKIESADSGDRTIKTNLLFSNGESREETLVMAKDGKSFDKTTVITDIEVQSQLTRVDDNTAP